MKQIKIILLLIIPFFSCNGQHGKKLINRADHSPKYLKSETYIFDNDTINQKVEVTFYDTVLEKKENKIYFKIYSLNKLANTHASFSDTAYFSFNTKAPDFGEYEDEIKDEMYSVVEFVYDKKCYLKIGIDYLTRNRLYLFEYNCDKLHRKECPFGSTGTLRRIDN